MNPRPDVKWKKVSERRYWDMLEILPPALMEGGKFMVGEPWDHGPCAVNGGEAYPRFSAFFRVDGAHYEGNKPMTRAEFQAMTAEDCRAAVVKREKANG
jgi:hypothetical protein